MEEVLNIFPNSLMAGFGNEQSDKDAYELVRIAEDKIWIINTNGEIKLPDGTNSS